MLICMGLSDRSVLNHIEPIIKLNNISKIIIIRDQKGLEIEKIIYRTPPKWSLQFHLIKNIIKLLMMIYYSIIEKPIIIHSYLLFPHGILCYITKLFTNQKSGISLIAGPMELFTFGSSPIEKYAYTRPILSKPNKILLYILKRFDYVTVTGSFTKKFLIEHGIDKNKIFILPHLVDKRFKPTYIKKRYDLIYVGRLTPVKNLTTLLKVAYLIKKKRKQIKICIVGDGSEKTKLLKIIKYYHIEKNIDSVGYQENVWEWYPKAKISIILSEREGFPYSAIESLKCGIPVITSNCGDISDVIKNNYNGIIINNHLDAKLFALKTISLLNNSKIIKRLSINCLKSILKNDRKNVLNNWKIILSLK